MQRIPVESSDIKSVGYDPRTQILEIEFHSGGVYDYYAVPASVHQALIQAESKGKHFHANVKGKFAFIQVGGLPSRPYVTRWLPQRKRKAR